MHYVYIFAIFRYSNQTPLSLSPAPSATPSRASSSRSRSPQSRPPKKKKKASDQVDELLVAELHKERDEAGSFGDMWLHDFEGSVLDKELKPVWR